MNTIKLKVCGITNAKQMLQLDAGDIDYLGFVFNHDSKRHLGEFELKKLSTTTQATKVLVTFDEVFKTVVRLAEGLKTKTIQLHGTESPEYCENYRKEGYTVYKVIEINDGFHFESISKYIGCVDYFIFEYIPLKVKNSADQYDFKILDFYTGDVPFFIGGSLNNKHIEIINQIDNKMFKGVDVNSGFEITPGIKNVSLIKAFKQKI